MSVAVVEPGTAPVAAPVAPQAVATGTVLKLYVDSTSLPLVHQMADFVACADAPQVHKIVTWLRLPQSAAQLAGTQASYLPQMAAVSPAFVARVADTVRRLRPARVEIHANQYHAWRSVVPLLRALVPLFRDPAAALALRLYDDGTVGLLHRETLKADPDPAQALADAAHDLRRAVFDRQPLRWGVPQGYAWQALFDTRYHLLRPDLLLRDAPGRALHALLAPVSEAMRFDGLPALTEAQCARYLAGFGLDTEAADRLAPVAGRADALLFTGSAMWDKADNARLADSLLRAIASLRAGGCLPEGWPIAYKGHPANGDHDARLATALGRRVIVVPPRVPLEVLGMAGLLPQRVAGVLSSSYCTLPPERIEYLLCRRSAVSGGAGSPLVNLMLETGMVTAERLLPLLDAP